MIFGHNTDISSLDQFSTQSITSQFPLPPTTTNQRSIQFSNETVDDFGQDMLVQNSRSNSVPYHAGRLSVHGSANPSPHHSRHPSYSPQSALQTLPLASVDEDFRSWTIPTLDGNVSNGAGFDSRNYPASAPAWQTSFHIPPQQFDYNDYSDPKFTQPGSHEYGQQYVGTGRRASYAHYDPSYAPIDEFGPPLGIPASPSRPHSAPASQQQPDLIALQQGERRRGSSVESMAALRSTPPRYPPSPVPYNSAPSSISIQQRSSFSPIVSYPPPAVSYHSPPPPIPAVLPPATSPKKPKKVPKTPKKLKSPKKGAGGLAMFINFTSSDSAKLLAGVAPSGSSAKKRRLEEEAELEREKEGSPSKGRRTRE